MLNGTVVDIRCVFILLFVQNNTRFIGAEFEAFAFRNVDQQECTFNNQPGSPHDDCIKNQNNISYVESNIFTETYRWSHERLMYYADAISGYSSPYLWVTCDNEVNFYVYDRARL